MLIFHRNPEIRGTASFIIIYNFKSAKPTHVVLLVNFSCQTIDKLLFSHKIKCVRILAKRERYYLLYVSYIIIYIRKINLVSSISHYFLILTKTMRLQNVKSYRKILNFIIGCIK